MLFISSYRICDAKFRAYCLKISNEEKIVSI